jgi:hypothetical protein
MITVGGWTAAQWVHRVRRDLSFKTTEAVANYIQTLFEAADGHSGEYELAWQTLRAALSGKNSSENSSKSD